MKSTMFTSILLCLLSLSAFAQGETKKIEAYKVDEFGAMNDSDLNLRFQKIFNYEIGANPNSKVVFLVYVGIKYENKFKKAKYQKQILRQNINFFQYDKDKTIIQEAGFREKYTVEFWIVPEGAEMPKPTNVAEKIDELGKSPDEDVWVRLKNSLEKVKNSENKVYVINFGKKTDKAKRVKQIKKGIPRYNLDSSRFELIDGGYSKELKTEFWIIKK